MIDIHCHLIPGVDDGPQTLANAIDLCKALADDNIRTVIATPHMLNGRYDVNTQMVIENIKILENAVKEKNINLTILPGAEVHISSEILEKLQKNEILTLNNTGKYLLLELLNYEWPLNLQDLIFQLQLKNISTIIAHPERIYEVQKDNSILDTFIENEVFMQITASGIVGKFGKKNQTCCYELLKRNMVHFIATDAHSHIQRYPMLTEAKEQVYEWFGSSTVETLFEKNPSLLLEGKYIEIPKPGRIKKGWKKWFS